MDDKKMSIYNAVREVPQNAQKKITGGRLKGFTDINPMWRIQKLTEQFGPCGDGWKYTITDKRTIAGANGEIAAFIDIDLFYRLETGEWSEAVPGTGGSSFVANEKSGIRTSDECFKMALTDAISVACKSLGFGADVYWAAGRTKYSGNEQDGERPPLERVDPIQPIICDRCGQEILPAKRKDGSIWEVADMVAYTKRRFNLALCRQCGTQAEKDGGA